MNNKVLTLLTLLTTVILSACQALLTQEASTLTIVNQTGKVIAQVTAELCRSEDKNDGASEGNGKISVITKNIKAYQTVRISYSAACVHLTAYDRYDRQLGRQLRVSVPPSFHWSLL